MANFQFYYACKFLSRLAVLLCHRSHMLSLSLNFNENRGVGLSRESLVLFLSFHMNFHVIADPPFPLGQNNPPQEYSGYIDVQDCEDRLFDCSVHHIHTAQYLHTIILLKFMS